jgi:hydroxylamine dehydrogenase
MTKRRYWQHLILMATGILCLGVSTANGYYVDPKKFGSPAGEICIQCHKEATPGIYNQWKESAMGQAGVNCYDCHRAEEGDPDAFEHKELISIVVSPKDCSRCHEKEYKEFESSRHSEAVDRLHSPSGEAVGAAAGDRTGCNPCHGSVLQVEEGGKLNSAGWPNTGIGRINPDKSKGACTACHTRHLFSREQARRPDACGRCHTGDAHPQKEVYGGSKHGVMYAAFRDEMNMDKRQWLAGRDYYQGPTCVSCHMGAMPPQMDVKNADERIDQALRSALKGDEQKFAALLRPIRVTKRYYGATHDVSARLAWDFKAPISEKREHWQEKMEMMQAVCKQCHGDHFVSQQYMQFDRLVEQYNKKYAIPATNMRKALINDGKLSPDNYDDPLDTIYWKLVDQEGRKARNGAAMINPDYAWNEGMQAVTACFYNEFVPEVRRLLGRKADSFLKEHGYQETDQHD